MKRLICLLAIEVLLIAATVINGQTAPPQGCNEWISTVIRQIGTLQQGSTRHDLEELFVIDGGVSTVSKATYRYKECPYIKVDVTFALVRPDRSESPADKIESISHPYLAGSQID